MTASKNFSKMFILNVNFVNNGEDLFLQYLIYFILFIFNIYLSQK